MNEFELIQTYFQRDPLDPSVILGNGDDAAVVSQHSHFETVVSVDSVITGRHVPLMCPPDGFAARLLGRGLSDLAAMGAEPKSVLLSLTLPTIEPGWIDHFANRFHQLCVRFGVDLIGGDTTKGPLSAHLTVLGQVPKGSAVTRSGLKSGDDLWLFGPDLGGARAYLDVLDGQETDHEIWAERYWRPEPQLDAGVSLRGVASAMIDVSDGLCQDLVHLLDHAVDSVTVKLQSKLFPVCQDLVDRFGQDKALEYALTGGDDYCLLASIRRGVTVPTGGRRIGMVVKGETDRILLDGEPLPNAWQLGWDHSQ
ncbi:MAG: thiamine-phosphate kinase [Pseudomonadota bacterium]|nr:thiamine-phosphate kinase [Pseudomonadota bacterium]